MKRLSHLSAVCLPLATSLGCAEGQLRSHTIPTVLDSDLSAPSAPMREGEFVRLLLPPSADTGSGLVINELMADNESTLMTEEYTFPDWVELYNGGSSSVDLAHVALWDSSGSAWVGHDLLDAGDHLLLLADDSEEEGHLPFAIAKAGDELWLSQDGLAIDAIRTGLLEGDVAAARVPDGGPWLPTILPTPGSANHVAGTDSTDPRDSVFQTNHVIQVQVWATDDDIAMLNTASYCGGHVWTEVSLSIDGIWFPSVAMTLKGCGSFETLDGKPAMKFDLNDYEPGRKFRHLDHLTFNNGVVWDPTWTHEYLTYSVYREAGITAPRVGWTRVFINDTDYGLYMNVEDYDHELLERWYSDPDGALYEGSGDFYTGAESSMDYEEGPDEQDLSVITQVVDVVSSTSASDDDMFVLGQYIDLDEFARYMALETVTLHWDGYQSPNNWRFYHEPVSSLIQWLPSGTDYTWSYNNSRGNLEYGNGLVFRYCLENATWLAEYEDELLDLATMTVDMDLPTTFEDLTDWLTPEIETDERTPHSPDSIAAAQESTRNYLENWPEHVVDHFDP
jgi:hypothetical protein